MADTSTPSLADAAEPTRVSTTPELLSGLPEAAFDRLTGLVARLLRVPVSLTTLVQEDKQVFKSVYGTAEPWLSVKETPLSHSFCQYVQASSEPLRVEDARMHPLVKDNRAVHDLHVIAYLGVPLFTPEGQTVATLCAIDHKVRHWTDDDVKTIKELAELAMTEIALRLSVNERDQANKALNTLNRELSTKVQERTLEVLALANELTVAEQNERRRIAQNVHDTVQQQLYAIQFALHRARQETPGQTESARDAVEEAFALLKDALTITRRVTADLGSAVAMGEGFGQTLEKLAAQMKARHGLNVKVAYPDTLPTPHESVRHLLFQVVRELLFNIVKHAAVAEATVSVRRENGMLTLVIQDLGSGFDTTEVVPSGLGHSEMRRRLELFGGKLELTSEPGEGTRAAIVLPAELLSLV